MLQCNKSEAFHEDAFFAVGRWRDLGAYRALALFADSSRQSPPRPLLRLSVSAAILHCVSEQACSTVSSNKETFA
jgi:hypothetical protein